MYTREELIEAIIVEMQKEGLGHKIRKFAYENPAKFHTGGALAHGALAVVHGRYGAAERKAGKAAVGNTLLALGNTGLALAHTRQAVSRNPVKYNAKEYSADAKAVGQARGRKAKKAALMKSKYSAYNN